MVPTTSVVVCSRGRPRLVRDVVGSILAMELLPTELVIVDQSDERNPDVEAMGSTTSVDVRYLWAPDRGLSRARNVGLEAARGEIVACTDDDIFVDPHWLGGLVEALLSRDVRHVVTGQVREGEPEVPGAWAPSVITDARARTYAGQLDRDVLYPSNMAMYRSAFEEIGPFDERLGAGTSLPSAEDNDFCYRLLRAGYVIEYSPDIVVTHRAWRQENALPALRYDYGRGQGAFYLKYAVQGDRFMTRRFALDLVRHLRRAVTRSLRGHLQAARGDAAYSRGLVSGAVAWLRAK